MKQENFFQQSYILSFCFLDCIMKIQDYLDLSNKTLEKLPKTWVSYLWSGFYLIMVPAF